MKLNEYQNRARATAIYPRHTALAYCVLGLTGEAGEVADKVKKIIRDNDGVLTKESKQEIAKELGDVLWYLANLSAELGFDLQSVAEMNIQKLVSRKQRGKLSGSGDNR